MPIKVHLPTALRPYAGKQEDLSLEGRSVKEVLEGLAARHAQLRKHLFSDEGKLRNFVNVYLNDQDIRHLGGVETPVKEGDQLMIVPSIAGGSSGASAPSAPAGLSAAEIKRYSRHLIMPEVGMEGQKKLKAARVLCVGAGGLGSPSTLYLAAAGVGTIGLVDFDVVDLSNLQRQVLFAEDQVGKPKLAMARERLKGLNPGIDVVAHEGRLTSANALALFKDYDVIIDGTDNFPTRYLVNDACVLSGKPNVYASIFRFDGQVSVFWAKKGPCYRCLYPDPPPPGLIPSCAEGGVLGVLPGVIGTLQALETIKLILGAGEPLIGTLLLFDALKMDWKRLALRKDADCPICGSRPSVTKLADYEAFCGLEPHASPAEGLPQITVETLKERLEAGENLFILDVREEHESEICRIEGSHLIPLRDLPQRASELDSADEIVVHCKVGGRSAQAVRLLRQLGFGKVVNLEGGIDAWAERIDPALPRY